MQMLQKHISLQKRELCSKPF